MGLMSFWLSANDMVLLVIKIFFLLAVFMLVIISVIFITQIFKYSIQVFYEAGIPPFKTMTLQNNTCFPAEHELRCGQT